MIDHEPFKVSEARIKYGDSSWEGFKRMKEIILSEEEARAIVKTLKSNWIPLDDQKTIYNLISRIERELEIE